MPFGWEGEKIRLVPLEKERHFDNCIRWLNDPDVTAWLLTGDFPITRLAEQDFFDRCARPGDQATDIVFAIERRDDTEEHVGMCGLHNINHRHGVGVAGITIGRPQLWSRGLGTDAFRTLVRYAFDVLGLQLILSEAFAENERSVRLHARCEFEAIGMTPRRYWKRGAYRDIINYCRLRDRRHQTTNPNSDDQL